jgi:hypothetical protein
MNDMSRPEAAHESPAKTTTSMVTEIASFAEMAEKNDRWWYYLGVDAGIELGRKQVLAELEADWIERRRTENLVPTGETGLDGLPIYVLRLHPPTIPVSFAELQRRRAQPGPLAREPQGGAVKWKAPLHDDWPVDPLACPSCGWPRNDRAHCCRFRQPTIAEPQPRRGVA